MQKLLSFPDLSQNTVSHQDCRFLVIEVLQSETGSSLQLCHSLSPQVMHWQDHIWLVDLASCLAYWQAQAQIKQLTLSQGLSKQLDQLFGTGSYRAVLSDHPWQALLLLPCLARQNMQSLIARHSRMGENLLQGLSWDDWWEACAHYTGHSQEQSPALELQKRRRPMQLAMRRLGCSTPSTIKNMPSSQIRRRFGALLGELWDMTWQSPSAPIVTSNRSPASLSFPWHSEEQAAELSVRRCLDTPLRDWDIIEGELRDDLNRFCLLSSFKKAQRILAMEWKIVLYNLKEISVPILFRHPHSLQQDHPQQRTALLQIFYALQKALLQQRLQNPEEPCDWIASWELRITQTLLAPPRAATLFADGDDTSWEELLNLENQLPAPLESYALREDWVPQDSFIQVHQEKLAPPLGEHMESLCSLGRTRPLYMQKKAYPLFHLGQSRLWKFRERTMEKWWTRPGHPGVRDYYEVLCDEQLLWVAREAEEKYLVLGVYG